VGIEAKVTKARLMREGGNVQRCHVVPHYDQYSVGKHTFDMLVLLEALHPKPTKALFRAVLMHDLAERYTGDVPGMVARIDPDFKQAFRNAGALVDEVCGYEVELSDAERRWVKALDKIELWLWCHDQLNMGNDHVGAMVDELELWFSENWKSLPAACRRFYKRYEWKRCEEVPD
jgi:5'-deoxynucleotidase YfbR-like HD superfamily hydrolase